MNKTVNNEQQEHIQKCRELIQSQKTLLLSTVTDQGKPEASYAPYVRDEQGVFYIYVSDLAVHTKNMLQQGSVSILFIRAENETNNLFARERVVFQCKVDEVQQDDECYEKQLQTMKDKFGETVELLRSLSDFHLLALIPDNGKYIAGFGQAFAINVTDDSLRFDD